MKVFWCSAIFLFLASLVSAQIASDTIGCVPLLVSFKSPDQTLSNPVWDFMDGASADKLNPNHVFTKPGVYMVKLSNGSQKITEIRITVLPELVPNIAVDTNQGCAPLSINFKDLSTLPEGLSITGYLWDFGDGVGSVEKDPVHTYLNIGHFDVALNITTSIPQCNVTKIFEKHILITEKQNFFFTIDSISPACTFPTYLHLKFQGEIDSSFTYFWDFGNGTFSDKAQPDPIRYDKQGHYDIDLEVDNNKGCRSRIQTRVSVILFPEFQKNFRDTLCYKAITTLTNNIVASEYYWNFGPDAKPQESTLRIPVVQFTKKGFQDIKLKIKTNYGCERDTIYKVFVEDPDAAFDIEPDSSCMLPQAFNLTAKIKNYKNYFWDDVQAGPQYTIMQKNIERDSFYYNKFDSISVQLSVTSRNGCIGMSSGKYYLQLPNSQFEVNTFEGEVPFHLFITDKSESLDPIVKWIISWGDGTSDEYDATTIAEANHIYDYSGRYYVNMAIITENGCMDKYFGAWIEVHDPITLVSGNCGLDYNPIFCVSDTVQFILSNVPDGVDAVQIGIGNTFSHCEKTLTGFYYGSGDPGIYNIDITLENGGHFYEVNKNNLARIIGARARINYQVNCTDRYKVFFDNNSLNATDIYWIVMGDTIRKDTFYYTFPGKGDYRVKLVASNSQDNCRPDIDEVTISLRDPVATIDAQPKWCEGVKNMLISSRSTDEVVGCKFGYLWSFPKEIKHANIVTDQDTIETKLPAGRHRISLEVRDVNGCRDTAYTDVEVYRIEANFESDKTKLCKPITATLRDLSYHDLPIIDYSWSVDESKNAPVITHTFNMLPSKDSIVIGLTVIDSLGCMSHKDSTFMIYSPKTDLEYEPVICEGQDILISASDFTEMGSHLNYEWNTANTPPTGINPFVVTSPKPGLHDINLKITEQSTLCENDYKLQIRVTKKPEAMISGIGDSLYCYPRTLQLTAENSAVDTFDSVNYLWDFGNSQSANLLNPVTTFKKGKYTVLLTIRSKYGCEDTVSKDITLVGPEGQLFADKDKVCKGENITFSLSGLKDVSSFFWDFGQGVTAENISPYSYKYDFVPESGKTFVSVVLKSAETGCETILTSPVNIYQVKADFTQLQTCEDTIKIVNLSKGADQHVWSHQGNIISNQPEPLIHFSQSGSYNLTLAIKNITSGCTDTVSGIITFLDKPVINSPASASLCGNETIKIPAEKEISYVFDPPGLALVSGDSIIIGSSFSTNLQIIATGKNGCTQSKTIKILHSKNVSIDTMIEAARCMNKELTLDLGLASGDVIEWIQDGGALQPGVLSCVSCNNPVVSPEFTGNLTAVLTNAAKCRKINITYHVFSVRAEMPNVFSPNNDMYNDVFRPVTTDPSTDLEIINLTIFNRWGKQVYSSDQPWDGTIAGHPAPSEVYLYKITFRADDLCTATYRGEVTLLR